METKKSSKNKLMPYVIAFLIVGASIIILRHLNTKVNIVESIPSTPFAGTLIAIPESQVEGFDINKLKEASIFNWAIDGQANVGLAYEKEHGFNFMADVVDRADKSEKPMHKFYQYNNRNWLSVRTEADRFLAAYGYKVDFDNSKDLKKFIEFMSK